MIRDAEFQDAVFAQSVPVILGQYISGMTEHAGGAGPLGRIGAEDLEKVADMAVQMAKVALASRHKQIGRVL